MTAPAPDLRSLQRRALDEQIASEPPLSPLDLPPGATASAVEALLASRRRPLAVAGVVENGLVRPLDPIGIYTTRNFLRDGYLQALS